MRFLAALQLLTIIPLRRQFDPEDVKRSPVYFPVVGIVIGVIVATLAWLLGLVLSQSIVSALIVVFLVIITGGMHLDGLSDTCDGLAGHRNPEERWQVMHDSHAGAFGVIGVASVLLVKYVSLNSLPRDIILPALLLMPVVSRWAMVYAIVSCPYARPSGMGKAFKEGANWPELTVTTILTLAVAAIILQVAGVVIVLAVWAIVLGVTNYLKRKFAGLTGDTYGAVNEVAEISVLIIVSLLANNQWLGLA